MQLFTPSTTLPSRLALVLALAFFSFSASAAPHQHEKCCNPALYMQCVEASDCCAFSYCQNISGDPNIVTGVSDDTDSEYIVLVLTDYQSCFPGFSETPYVKTVTPETALSPPPQPTGGHQGGPAESTCGPHWYDNIFGC